MSDTKSILEDLDYLISEYSSLSILWQKELPVKLLDELNNVSLCSHFLTLLNLFKPFYERYLTDEYDDLRLTFSSDSSQNNLNFSECDSKIIGELLARIISQRKLIIELLTSNEIDRVNQGITTKLDQEESYFNEQLSVLIQQERGTLINISKAIYDVEKDKMSMRSLSRSHN